MQHALGLKLCHGHNTLLEGDWLELLVVLDQIRPAGAVDVYAIASDHQVRVEHAPSEEPLELPKLSWLARHALISAPRSRCG